MTDTPDNAMMRQSATRAIASLLVSSTLLSGCIAPPTAAPPLAPPVVSPREAARQKLGLTARDTRIEFTTQPRQVVAGSLALWSLKVLETKRKENGKSDYIRSFQTDHNQLLHLIVVSRDLSFWKHLKPDYKDYGHFLIATTLPRAGRYQLFADYTPYQGSEEVARQQIVVAPEASGKTPTDAMPALRADTIKNNRITKQVVPAGKNAPSATSAHETVSGETVSSETVSSYGAVGQVMLMLPDAARDKTSRSGLVAGRESTLLFQLRDGDGSVLADSSLDESASQCFIVSGDGAIYLHPRSVSQGGAAQAGTRQARAARAGFSVRFPAPGIYKVWFEFYLRDELLVAPFVLNVAAPTPPA